MAKFVVPVMVDNDEGIETVLSVEHPTLGLGDFEEAWEKALTDTIPDDAADAPVGAVVGEFSIYDLIENLRKAGWSVEDIEWVKVEY